MPTKSPHNSTHTPRLFIRRSCHRGRGIPASPPYPRYWHERAPFNSAQCALEIDFCGIRRKRHRGPNVTRGLAESTHSNVAALGYDTQRGILTMQPSDDLVIQIFLWTSAFLAVVEAMKASGWRVWAFGILAFVLFVLGAAWSWLKEVYRH